MTLEPYPDLSGAEPQEPPVPASVGDGDGDPGGRSELSEADSRLLDALSRPEPPVVTAVEDQLRTAPARDEDVAPLRPPGGRGALTPVFQEPAG